MPLVRAARPQAFLCVAKTPDGAKRQVPAGVAQNRYAVCLPKGARNAGEKLQLQPG